MDREQNNIQQPTYIRNIRQIGLSPELALHGLVVSEPMNIKTLDQLVDLIELRLGEGDRSRRQVLENTTLLTRGNR